MDRLNEKVRSQASDLIRFGPYELEPQTGEVRKFGVRLKLAGQPLEVLLLLVERAGQLVTREELQQRLWPQDVFVDFERSLNSAVKKLRAALNDNPENPRYIETHPRKGYRFIASIEQVVPPEQGAIEISPPAPQVAVSGDPANIVPPSSDSNNWPWAAVAILLVFVGGVVLAIRHGTPKTAIATPISRGPNVRSSVAILGFKNLSSQHEGDWLGTAIVQMLTTELQTGGKLRIIPDETVAHAKRDLDLKEKDGYPRDTLRELQKDLASDYIVAGSYVALGNKESGQVRLDLRLQETISGETLASIAVSGKQAEIFDLVGRAGRDMRAKVEGTMGPGGDEDWRAVLPSNPDARSLYTEGLSQMRAGNSVSATDVLQKSLAIEPEFALGHSALAGAWQSLGYDARAQASAQKALSMAASLPENVRLKIEAQYYESQHDWDGAIPAYRHLFQDYPDDLEAGLKLAETDVSAGKLSDAASTISSLRSLQTASRQDPRIDLVDALVASRRSDFVAQQELARSAAKKAELSGFSLLSARARMLEGWALDDQAQLDQALLAYRAAQPIFDSAGDIDSAATVLDDIGIVLEKQGDLRAARDSLLEAQKRFRQIGDQNGLGASLTNLGELYHAEGDLSPAADLYREAIELFRKSSRKENEYAALNNLGGVLSERGDFRGARRSFESLLEYKQTSGDKGGVAYAKMNLAGVLWVQGDLDSSARFLEEALHTFRDIGDQGGISSADNAYAKVLILKNDLGAARQTLSEALAVDRKIGAKGGLAVDQIDLAKVDIEDGHIEKVDDAALQSAIDEVHEEQRGADEVEALTIQIEAFLMRGKVASAQQSLARAEAVHHTSWLTKYHLLLATAHIDAAQGKIVASRRTIEAARSQARKVDCGACTLESTIVLSKLDALSAR